MDSSFAGFVLDPSKCSKLSMEEKRELVYEVSKWSQGAPEMLQSWSRRELLQILCAEMGKERKYTGLTKIKMIEHLLRIVSENKAGRKVDGTDSVSPPPPANIQSSSKRQRKTDHPSRVAINQLQNGSLSPDNGIYCQNLACRAAVNHEDKFCKRCSCCICYKYDDNKDPSLWLVCNSDPPNQGDSCGISCHLECALKHEKAGIIKGGQHEKLDGSFYCISCRKVNDLLGCWKKQLIKARDARRVDILCYRLSLSRMILSGTKKYQKLQEIVNVAVEKLEEEEGSLDGIPVRMARGIVNRLSSGAEVQKLCASAVDMVESMLCSILPVCTDLKMQDASLISVSIISFEDVSPTSVAVVLGSEDVSPEEVAGYTLWHRKLDTTDYPAEPTCSLFGPNRRVLVSELTPGTDYVFKVVSFGNTGESGKWEARLMTSSFEDVMKTSTEAGCLVDLNSGSPKTSDLSNPSSDGDESNNTAYGDQDNSMSSYSGRGDKTEIRDLGKSSDYTCKEITLMQNTSIGSIAQRTDVRQATEQEELLGGSASVLDEEHATAEVGSVPSSIIQIDSQRDSTTSSDGNQASHVPKPENKDQSRAQLLEEISIDDALTAHVRNEMEVVPAEHPVSVLPVTPSKQELSKDGSGRNGRTKVGGLELENWFKKPEKEPLAGCSSKKRTLGRCEVTCNRDGSLEGDYEYCVRMIRWLECEGHLEKEFRVKFLTWFSLRATPQERKIVRVYVDTLIEDPTSLAGQLVDTFSEGINNKGPQGLPSGFCMKLWH